MTFTCPLPLRARARVSVAGKASADGGGCGSCGSTPVARAVSLRWLLDFAHACRGTEHSWEVATDHLAKEYLAPADGGGGAAPLVITREQLAAHRAARARAEAERSGKPVVVRYVDIPFEQMYTSDVVECFVR